MAREYVDKDLLLKALQDKQQFCLSTYATGRMFFAMDNAIVKEQPTADVVEVKHSRWENISGFDVCNICGTSPAYCEPEPNNPKGYPPYCHNCGAKMDERRDT